MSHKIGGSAQPRQAQPDSQPVAERGNHLSPDDGERGRELSLLRQAIDDSAWTHEALAAEQSMPVANAAYISRMLSGEKAWTTKHTDGLPREIRIQYHASALRREGVLVVLPAPLEQVAETFASGLFGVLALVGALDRRLPVESSGQLKAALPVGQVERRRA